MDTRAILRADAARRQERELDESLMLAQRAREASKRNAPEYDRDAYANRELLQGIGVISPPRKYPNRAPLDKCVGTALRGGIEGTPILMDGRATVRVMRPDGTDTIVPASNFRKSHKTRSARKQGATVADSRPDVIRYVDIVGNIGNVE